MVVVVGWVMVTERVRCCGREEYMGVGGGYMGRGLGGMHVQCSGGEGCLHASVAFDSCTVTH